MSDSNAVERTFVMLKPDALERGLIGEIISRLERKGLKPVRFLWRAVSPELAAKHLAVTPLKLLLYVWNCCLHPSVTSSTTVFILLAATARTRIVAPWLFLRNNRHCDTDIA